jgi:hypothetical protein
MADEEPKPAELPVDEKPKRLKRVVGRPFPKGFSGNPLGRKKIDPLVQQTLEAGNMVQLERLWALSESRNERVALAAIQTWLLKTVPNAEKLELTGAGGGSIKIEAVREKLAEKLAKKLEQIRAAAPAKSLPEGG